MSAAVRLEVTGLTKRFGGLVAVNNLGFEVRAGEILGLIGPNGSGKSTVMKLLMAIERADGGTVKLNGEDVSRWPPHRIARAGIGIVFQHSRPLRRQTVLENIKLALLPDSLWRLAAGPHVDARARALADRVGLREVINRHPSELSFTDIRRMELAKAIARNPKVVLLDEPFAGLSASELESFSQLIRDFRDEGIAVLLVDHNVKSVAALADRVLAMYLGEKIAEGSVESVMRSEAVRRVYLGGRLESLSSRGERKESNCLLEISNVTVHYGKAQALDRVSLHVREGECVAVVGLNGSGKTSLFNAISGLVPYAGKICFKNRDLTGVSAGAIARNGIVQCPENRELFEEMSVRENLDLGGNHLPADARARQLEWLFDLFPVLGTRQSQPARTLSGGEQQMLAIARALMMKPSLLILDEPTLGLAPVILQQLSAALDQLRASGAMTVLLGEQNVSFALPHADRIYVLEHSRIIWEGSPRSFVSQIGDSFFSSHDSRGLGSTQMYTAG